VLRFRIAWDVGFECGWCCALRGLCSKAGSGVMFWWVSLRDFGIVLVGVLSFVYGLAVVAGLRLSVTRFVLCVRVVRSRWWG